MAIESFPLGLQIAYTKIAGSASAFGGKTNRERMGAGVPHGLQNRSGLGRGWVGSIPTRSRHVEQDMIQVTWKGGMAFEADPPSGNRFTFDSHPETGGQNHGPTPVETLLGSVAACTAMDVISILAKKRQEVTSYSLMVEWDRGPVGEWPRPIIGIRIKHLLKGPNLDPVAVARAVELSDEKYCSVAATLRQSPKIETSWEID